MNNKPQPIANKLIQGLAQNFSFTEPTSEKSKKTTSKASKYLFEQKVEGLQPISGYWLFLTKEAFSITMDNYRLFATQHNNEVYAANVEIDNYNASVANFLAENPLNEVQKAFGAIFVKTNSKKTAKEYNALVEDFNEQRGLCLTKKPLPTLKYGSEVVFQNMLHLYGCQLAKYANEHIKLATNEKQTVKAFSCNSYHIVSLERSNDTETIVKSINVCTKTIRNHRAKLEEAGVFIDYEFRGHKKGVDLQFNPTILTLFDAKTNYFTSSENQVLSPQTRKKFPYKNKENTRTLIKINNTENPQGDFLDKGTASPDLLFDFYGNIQVHDKKGKLEGGAENVKICAENVKIDTKEANSEQTISDKFKNYLHRDRDLIQRLAKGEFHNYKRLDFKYLEKEAYNGTLLRAEMMEVVKHEFFKQLSRIYRKSTPYIGTWQRAFEEFDEQFYVSNGNGKFLVSKDMMVDKLKKWCWMIHKAEKWFKKANIRPLNPHHYLDTLRKDKKEIGFFFLEKHYKAHIKDQENKPLRIANKKKEANKRAVNINYSRKFDGKMAQFMRNKISLNEFIEYVQANLPAPYMEKLSETIIKFNTQTYTC